MGSGSKMQAQPSARRRSTLDAIKQGALTMALELYKETGREVRGLGVAVDEDTFAVAAIMFVERTADQAGGDRAHQDRRLADIHEADGKIENAGQEIPIRIAREDLIRS